MTARQQHGFMFESILTDNLIGFMHNDEYTGQYDGTFMHIPCSVKCMGMHGDICLSSFTRIVTDNDQSLMFLGIRDRTSHSLMMSTLYFPAGTRGLFHPYESETEALIQQFTCYLHNDVLNSRLYDKQWQSRLNEFKNEYSNIFHDTDSLIMPRPKRDHKHQKRLQCAVPYNRRDEFIRTYELANVPIIDVMQATAEDWLSVSSAVVDSLHT